MKLLQDVLMKAAAVHGHRTAFDSEDHCLTFNELTQRIQCISGALENLGVKKGDRIAILAPNCDDYIVYHYAAAVLGAILLVLNVRHTASEMLYALNNAEAGALVVHELFCGQVEALVSNCPSIRFTIGLGTAQGVTYPNKALLADNRRVKNPPKLTEKDPILLIFTSGTTGRPKGALQTHEGSVMVDALTAKALEASENDVYLAFMPYFHQAGLIRTRAVMTSGGVNLIAGKIDPESVADYLARKNVSITMLVPPYDTKLTEIADRDKLVFPNLRYIIGAGGAGPIHAKRMQAFCEKFNCRYMGIYGQTEVTGPATLILGKDYFQKPQSCGKPMQGIDLEIWDDSGRPVEAGTIGEIMIRAKTCVPGYWRNESADRELYSGKWLHTGDLGKLDRDGFLYFVDRKKELIKTGGENVYPREVEDVLKEHPAVADVAVIGLPDPDSWGELVTCAVVMKKGRSVALEELRSFCRGKIAGYKIPKMMRCVETIPRNATGKPLKMELKELLKSEQKR